MNKDKRLLMSNKAKSSSVIKEVETKVNEIERLLKVFDSNDKNYKTILAIKDLTNKLTNLIMKN